MTYHLEHTTEEGLEVGYTYTNDLGTRIDPPYTEVEINELHYKGVDVYSLVMYVADDYICSLIEQLEEKGYES